MTAQNAGGMSSLEYHVLLAMANGLEQAVADGNVVVVDFTAEWCITCKMVEARILNPQPVKGPKALRKVAILAIYKTLRPVAAV